MSNITYHSKTTHSMSYYASLVAALIAALTAHKTDRQVADALNEQGLKSPAGKSWTTATVKTTLFNLRNYDSKPSKLHKAILQMCFDQVLRPAETLILFALRKPNEGVM